MNPSAIVSPIRYQSMFLTRLLAILQKTSIQYSQKVCTLSQLMKSRIFATAPLMPSAMIRPTSSYSPAAKASLIRLMKSEIADSMGISSNMPAISAAPPPPPPPPPPPLPLESSLRMSSLSKDASCLLASLAAPAAALPALPTPFAKFSAPLVAFIYVLPPVIALMNCAM